MRIVRLTVPLLIVLFLVPVVRAEHDPPRGIPNRAEPATVREIVDGDTFRVTLEDGTKDTVRLIGIDTPETRSPGDPVECYGPEASAQLAKLLRIGREVWLETDVSNRDRYDRLLRYVWVSKNDGGRYMVNEVMVRDGFAEAKRYEPDTARAERLDKAERGAQQRGRGIWSACPEYAQQLAPPAEVPVTVPTQAPVVVEDPATAFPQEEQSIGGGCDPSYPDLCLQSFPDLDCGDIPNRRFTVYQPDPHRFDGDYDGIGCESG